MGVIVKVLFLFLLLTVSSDGSSAGSSSILPNCYVQSRPEIIRRDFESLDKIFYGRGGSPEIIERYAFKNAQAGQTFNRIKFKLTYVVILPIKGALPFSKVDIYYDELEKDYAAFLESKKKNLWHKIRKYNDGVFHDYKTTDYCNRRATIAELISHVGIKYFFPLFLVASFGWLGFILLKRKIYGRAH